MRIAQLSDVRRGPLPLEEGEGQGGGVVEERAIEGGTRVVKFRTAI